VTQFHYATSEALSALCIRMAEKQKRADPHTAPPSL
jgi:hypothetical protein